MASRNEVRCRVYPARPFPADAANIVSPQNAAPTPADGNTHVVLPADPQLFANRARRFEHLSRDSALGPLLKAMARIAKVAGDLAVHTALGGWRLSGSPGRDLSRADGYWSEDLDAIDLLQRNHFPGGAATNANGALLRINANAVNDQHGHPGF